MDGKTREDILRAAKAGELREISHAGVELKSSWRKEFGQKISGLANAQSPVRKWLIVGVGDGGELTGLTLSEAADIEHRLSAHVNEYLSPVMAVRYIGAEEVSPGCISSKHLGQPRLVC